MVIKDAPELVKAYETTITMHAAHSHPYKRQATTGSLGTPLAMASGNGEIHGNKNTKVYHLPDCPGYEAMLPANMVPFASETAAQQAGYWKAENCP